MTVVEVEGVQPPLPRGGYPPHPIPPPPPLPPYCVGGVGWGWGFRRGCLTGLPESLDVLSRSSFSVLVVHWGGFEGRYPESFFSLLHPRPIRVGTVFGTGVPSSDEWVGTGTSLTTPRVSPLRERG